MSIADVPSHYLTIAEVAAVLRVSKMTVYRLVRAHALASVRFGNSYRIAENAVEEYIRKAGLSAES
ncbi:helix-turn-helix domain-containing protein [Arthrobacter sp. ISL-95]|uniref:helix-turn-helix domain-containing protein n=1 Tax=Arthrobacter sp. ISL-95 TaxID=2819116 RepID=UPI001BE88DB1|nr:helix-turn-helix domain-containing protein [Arthrobacter sp. ISL-95]MBT2588375.1 helix-turn-helix domain-containing protein [Arthrobacter sp. ISL-95]